MLARRLKTLAVRWRIDYWRAVRRNFLPLLKLRRRQEVQADETARRTEDSHHSREASGAIAGKSLGRAGRNRRRDPGHRNYSTRFLRRVGCGAIERQKISVASRDQREWRRSIGRATYSFETSGRRPRCFQGCSHWSSNR